VVFMVQMWVFYGVAASFWYGQSDVSDWMDHPNCTYLRYNPTLRTFDGIKELNQKDFKFVQYSDPTSFIYSNFVLNGRPVVIKGAMIEWTPVDKWTNDFLKERIGDIKVLMSTGNKTSHFGAVNSHMNFYNFLDTVSNASMGEAGVYMSTQKFQIKNPDGSMNSTLLDIPGKYLKNDYSEPFFHETIWTFF